MRGPAALTISLAFGLAAMTAAAGEGDARLENGLRAIIRPVRGTERVALVTVFRVGEAHEPEGRSGLAHLTEHLYFVGAAGRVPARTIDGVVAAYPDGWNAHTSFDYTVVATVFPKARLAEELADAAARMGGGLRIEDAVLERERDRIIEELDAMYARQPSLAAGNRGRELLFPPRAGTRRGGTPEALATATAAEVQERIARLYKPRNAIVALAGAIEPAEGLAAIRKAFGAIPAGDPPPAPAPFARAVEKPGVLDLPMGARGGAAGAGGADIPGGFGPGGGAIACFPAPRPDDPSYGPFLVAVARLAVAGWRAGCHVNFPPFEDGRVLAISSRAGRAALERFLDEGVPAALGPPVQEREAEVAANWVLGNEREMGEYEAAFRAAMHLHHGIVPGALRHAIGATTPAALAKLRLGGPEGRARAALVTIRAAD